MNEEHDVMLSKQRLSGHHLTYVSGQTQVLSRGHVCTQLYPVSCVDIVFLSGIQALQMTLCFYIQLSSFVELLAIFVLVHHISPSTICSK